MSDRRRRQRGKKRVRDDEENVGSNQNDDIEGVLTDEEDDTFEDLEDELEETDLGKLVQSQRDKSKVHLMGNISGTIIVLLRLFLDPCLHYLARYYTQSTVSQ